mgnify:CR=1 FL=1
MSNSGIKYLQDVSKTWPEPLADNMTDERREIYLRKKKAVDMYISGKYSIRQIEKSTGEYHSNIAYLVEKCMHINKDGMFAGYNALIPYKQLLKQDGQFENFMDKHPDIRRYILLFYAGRKSEKFPSVSTTFRRFISKLTKLGFIEGKDYPLTLKDNGRRELYRWLKDIKNHDNEIAKTRISKDSRTLLRTTNGRIISPVSERPFARVEIDGHKIDAFFTVEYKISSGDIIHSTVSRIWVIVAIDIATNAILGYELCLEPEYNRFHVLKCIENAIKPHKPMSFSSSTLSYPKGEGFHSLAMPELAWAVPNEIYLDNAMAHLSKDVGDAMEKLKCSLNFGPVETPVRRPHIERFFGTLEEAVYHRLPSTTGSNPSDIRREKAEENALKFNISYNDIKELTEIAIAEYNVSQKNKSLNGFSPMMLMQNRISRGMYPRIMPEEEREGFTLMVFKETRIIRGSIEKGRRPYITYLNTNYTSPDIASAYDLVGEELTIEIDPEDLSHLKAYLSDGTSIGYLYAKGKMSKTALDLKSLKAINRYYSENNISENDFTDKIGDFIEEKTKNAHKSKKDSLRVLSISENAREKSPESPILEENQKGELVHMNTESLMTDDEIKAFIESDDNFTKNIK